MKRALVEGTRKKRSRGRKEVLVIASWKVAEDSVDAGNQKASENKKGKKIQ